MYQPDINTYLEAIRQEFETLKKDNKALKQENVRLLELNNQYFQKMNYYKELTKKNTVVEAKSASVLKMGSDWSVEGDRIFEVSLSNKLVMEEGIASVAISTDGRVLSFVSGRDVYVIVEEEILIIENDSKMVVYDREDQRNKRIRREGTYNYNVYQPATNNFGNYIQKQRDHTKPMSLKSVYFSPTSSYLFITESGGFVRVWDVKNKLLVRTIGLPDPRALCCCEELIYVISVDRALRIYDKDKLMTMITTTVDLEGPLLLSQDKEYAFCLGGNSLITFDLNRRTHTATPLSSDPVVDMSLLSGLGFLCLSTKASLNFYKTSLSPRFISSNENEEQNSCTTSFGNVLVVGHKKGISFYDIKNKRKMKINIDAGNTTSINSCNSHVVSVENRTTIRVWKHGDVK